MSDKRETAVLENATKEVIEGIAEAFKASKDNYKMYADTMDSIKLSKLKNKEHDLDIPDIAEDEEIPQNEQGGQEEMSQNEQEKIENENEYYDNYEKEAAEKATEWEEMIEQMEEVEQSVLEEAEKDGLYNKEEYEARDNDVSEMAAQMEKDEAAMEKATEVLGNNRDYASMTPEEKKIERGRLKAEKHQLEWDLYKTNKEISAMIQEAKEKGLPEGFANDIKKMQDRAAETQEAVNRKNKIIKQLKPSIKESKPVMAVKKQLAKMTASLHISAMEKRQALEEFNEKKATVKELMHNINKSEFYHEKAMFEASKDIAKELKEASKNHKFEKVMTAIGNVGRTIINKDNLDINEVGRSQKEIAALNVESFLQEAKQHTQNMREIHEKHKEQLKELIALKDEISNQKDKDGNKVKRSIKNKLEMHGLNREIKKLDKEIKKEGRKLDHKILKPLDPERRIQKWEEKKSEISSFDDLVKRATEKASQKSNTESKEQKERNDDAR